jgi:hypothetical protein
MDLKAITATAMATKPLRGTRAETTTPRTLETPETEGVAFRVNRTTTDITVRIGSWAAGKVALPF